MQHLAINTKDIITSVTNMRQRGCDFLTIPPNYYDTLRAALKTHNKTAKNPVTEDLDVLQKLNIMVDYDEHGYLLQIFTRPLEDRPTFFVKSFSVKTTMDLELVISRVFLNRSRRSKTFAAT